jgi:hypothetical protein
MKITITLLFITLTRTLFSQCAGATPITNGNCLSGQSLTTLSGGFVAGCNGGSNPFITYSFTAPVGCVDFDISNIVGNGTGLSWQYRFINAACSAVLGGGCVEQVSDGIGFTLTADNVSGGYLLTPGTAYFLQIMGDNPSTFTVCMSNNVEPSNSCAGAAGLGTGATTYFNGSAGCAFTGTQTGGTGDPAASLMCAGSLENTQWVNFSPAAGATSFQVVGTNITCTGGACAYQFGIFSSPTACGALTSEGCVANGAACGSGPDPISEVSTAGGNTLVWSSGVSTFTATITAGAGTFTGTEEFYLVMDGNAGASCTYTLTGVNVVPLPIEMVWFQVKALENANLLKFQIASQVDNDYFTVERTNDGENWIEIGEINGAGTTNVQTTYSFVDENYRLGHNYYRIKQTDYNGKHAYSEIRLANNGVMTKEIITIVNGLGQVVTIDQSGLIFIQYKDGSVEKRYNL